MLLMLLVLFDALAAIAALGALELLRRCPSGQIAGSEERSGLTRLRQNLEQVKLLLQVTKNLTCEGAQVSVEGFNLPLKVSKAVSGLSEM